MPATTWMPLYASDFISSTLDMTQSQIGAYIRLLCYAWENHGLPNDLEACGRIAGGLTPSDWKVIRRRLVVLDEGTSEERLSHPRMEAERAKCEAKYASKCAAAAKARAGRSVSNADINPDINPVVNIDNNHVISPQPEPEPELEPIKNDSSSSSTQKNLRASRQKPARTYRIGWSLAGSWEGISDEDRRLWREAYPAVDLTCELKRAHLWLRDNPQKAGKRNWAAFLGRWFARVQDKGGSGSSAAKPLERWVDKFVEAPYRTPKEVARLRRPAGPQEGDQSIKGVTTLSEAIGRLNVSQEPQNENHPD